MSGLVAGLCDCYLHGINGGRWISELKWWCAGAGGCVGGTRWGSYWKAAVVGCICPSAGKEER